jgi:hypothetical protein
MRDRTASLHDVLAALPPAEQHLSWMQEILGFGVRRPGTREGAQVVDWCTERLEELGFEVERQPVQALTSHPGPATVIATPTDRPDDATRFDGFTIPFTTPSPAGAGRFRLATRGDTDLSPDRAAFERVRLTELPVAALADAVLGHHDPDGEFRDHVQVLPFGAALGKEIDAVVDSKAGAMVGVVDAPWVSAQYFVPYDGVIRPIPGVWLDREQGDRLATLLDAGPVDVELITEVEHREAVDHNVIATAPGPDERDWIVVGSHHDAPWASAVEDASGIAQVLAQATAWAAVPPEARPASMAFLLTAAHMSHGAGTREFIRSWRHRDRIRFAIHLEHVAAEAVADGAGGLRPTGRSEVRWWFVSTPDETRTTALGQSVERAIVDEDLDRSLVLPPEIFGEMPPTDGGFFHLAGVPMVNLLAAPMYLFDPADTIEMIHQPSLMPTARAAARLIQEAGR